MMLVMHIQGGSMAAPGDSTTDTCKYGGKGFKLYEIMKKTFNANVFKQKCPL